MRGCSQDPIKLQSDSSVNRVSQHSVPIYFYSFSARKCSPAAWYPHSCSVVDVSSVAMFSFLLLMSLWLLANLTPKTVVVLIN